MVLRLKHLENPLPKESGIPRAHTSKHPQLGKSKGSPNIRMEGRHIGAVGEDFPLDFTIEVWDGANWIPRVSRTNYPKLSQGQIFTWGFSDATDRIRIRATRLRPVGADGYLFQLAEIAMYP